MSRSRRSSMIRRIHRTFCCRSFRGSEPGAAQPVRASIEPFRLIDLKPLERLGGLGRPAAALAVRVEPKATLTFDRLPRLRFLPESPAFGLGGFEGAAPAHI